ncbi:MAG: hypothetical protein REI11_18985, partial [Patulibacter sp.]|nr:hypothetical protein [Patulibacter sp.]
MRVSEEERRGMIEDRANMLSVPTIAARRYWSPRTVSRVLKRAGVTRPAPGSSPDIIAALRRAGRGGLTAKEIVEATSYTDSGARTILSRMVASG